VSAVFRSKRRDQQTGSQPADMPERKADACGYASVGYVDVANHFARRNISKDAIHGSDVAVKPGVDGLYSVEAGNEYSWRFPIFEKRKRSRFQASHDFPRTHRFQRRCWNLHASLSRGRHNSTKFDSALRAELQASNAFRIQSLNGTRISSGRLRAYRVHRSNTSKDTFPRVDVLARGCACPSARTGTAVRTFHLERVKQGFVSVRAYLAAGCTHNTAPGSPFLTSSVVRHELCGFRDRAGVQRNRRHCVRL
jgi:hypothetical protein